MRKIEITNAKHPFENRTKTLRVRYDENHSESVDLTDAELMGLKIMIEELFKDEENNSR
jgi:hypothetical protein